MKLVSAHPILGPSTWPAGCRSAYSRPTEDLPATSGGAARRDRGLYEEEL